MRKALIEIMKTEIEKSLKDYLREEGMELYIASNDNASITSAPIVELYAIEDVTLEGSLLLSEIKVILGILGKPWQCDALVNGLYAALHPHLITPRELTILLMSIHVESVACLRPRCIKKHAVMHYIIEETDAPALSANEEDGQQNIVKANAEYC